MKKVLQKIKKEFLNIFEKADKRAVYTILWMTLIITLYFYFGIQDFFEKTFNVPSEKMTYYKYVYHNFMAFFFFFMLSVPFVKFALKQKITDTGLRVENKALTLKLIIASAVIAPICRFVAALDKQMAATYPLGGEMIFLNFGFFVLYYSSYIAYYFGWEYLFRGLGLFNIGSRYGAALAISVTTMVSALIHSSIAGFGKPFSETFSAIAGGIIFGYMTYKAKNIYPALTAHFMLGFSMDMFIKLLS